MKHNSTDGVAPTVPPSLHKAVDTLLNTINSYRATLPQQVLERAQEVEAAQSIAGVALPAAFSTEQVRSMAAECGVTGTVQALHRFAVAAAAAGVKGLDDAQP